MRKYMIAKIQTIGTNIPPTPGGCPWAGAVTWANEKEKCNISFVRFTKLEREGEAERNAQSAPLGEGEILIVSVL
jgi:hypothetical protein